MIINFSIENFGSVKARQTLSFEAAKSEHLAEAYIAKAGRFRLLKLALIYGANASGKTTILTALDFLRTLVLEPNAQKTDSLEFEPFLFDAQTRQSSTILSITFIQNRVKYFYQINFYKRAILSERLDFFKPKEVSIFERKTDLKNQFTRIIFGNKITPAATVKASLEANTLWNNTVLGGFLKTNAQLYELKEATDWFRSYLKPLIFRQDKLKGYVTDLIDNSEISKTDLTSLLKKADFNISDIVLHKEEAEVPEELFKAFEEQLKTLAPSIRKIESKTKITSIELEFEHTIGEDKYNLPFELESQGIKRYYGFAGLLALLIKQSVAFPIDELETSLHPDLYLHFLLSFLLNSKNSQIIATTHNREILNNKDIFRDDAIWITDKDDSCATALYSLIDFDSSVLKAESNRLNTYNSGKLGGVPRLGDYYFDNSLSESKT